MAKAMASGSATRPTVTPAATSAAAVWRSYPRMAVTRRGEQVAALGPPERPDASQWPWQSGRVTPTHGQII